ncbi:MAG TPA: glutamyl-tRNA reductase [Nitrospiria bacterium]|nr:glutamyl-tRNA reductase [Nitrospiria bacterium]
MDIIVVGLNHRTTPIEIREKFSISDAQLREALIRLKSYHGIDEGLILSTCNRVEVCAVVQQLQTGFQRIKEFFEDFHTGLSREEWNASLYLYSADEAVRHVFRVASSLDSMVIGEPQILGQLKEAFNIAMHQNATGVILNKVFRKAISVAKRVRTETKIAENAVSISFAAVELAKKVFGRLEGKEALLVGAGEMAELAVRHLLDNGVRKVMITTRNFDNAIELAKRFDGIPLRLEEFPRYLAEADILICSTGASHYVISEEHIGKAIQRRMNRPIFLIDISVPRNIDPHVNRIDNVFLYDIDDLQLIVDANLEGRQKEALKAEGIVSEELQGFNKWLKSLEVVPTITALREKAEEIRRVEMNKFVSKLSRLSPEQREVVDGLIASIINKLLHSPLVALKDEARSKNGALYVEAVRRLFNLDKDLLHRHHPAASDKDDSAAPDEDAEAK